MGTITDDPSLREKRLVFSDRHDAGDDSFSATLRCHDANGELYNLKFARDRVALQSYSDDAIRTKVETWADTVPQLA